MKQKIRVIQYGLGTVGSAMVTLMLSKKGIDIVGALAHTRNIGKDLGEVIGMGKQLGVKVSNDADAVFSQVKADIVLHATVAFLPEVWSQIVKPVEAGMNVITVAGIGYPYTSVKYPELTKEVDEKAKEFGVTILSTGVNPGFALDLMPLVISGICREVKKIKIIRLVDLSTVRSAYLKGVGIGMTVDEFNKGRAGGSVKLGFANPESMSMIADSFEWELDEMKETAEPIIAQKYIEAPNIKIEAGRVCGYHEGRHGIKNGKELITFEIEAGVGLELEASTTISIEGDPNITETMVVQGSPGTPAIAVNMIPHVINAKPGLVTMKDFPIPYCLLRDPRDLIN